MENLPLRVEIFDTVRKKFKSRQEAMEVIDAKFQIMKLSTKMAFDAYISRNGGAIDSEITIEHIHFVEILDVDLNGTLVPGECYLEIKSKVFISIKTEPVWNDDDEFSETNIRCHKCGNKSVYSVFNRNPKGSMPLHINKCIRCGSTFDAD